MAHADKWKCSSKWSKKKKTQNVPDGHVIKVVAAVMDYAQWLLSDGVYKPIDELDIDIGNDNELLSLYWREEAYTNVY